MFGGLKDKLKNALGKFSKKVEEEGTEEKTEVEVTEEKTPEKEKKEVVVKHEVKTPEEEVLEEIREEVEKEEREEEISEEEPEEVKPEEKKEEKIEEPVIEEKPIEEEPKKEGFFKKLKKSVTTKKINDSQFEEFFYDLELALLENNVAVEVIEKIRDSLKMDIVNISIEKKEIDNIVENSLKKSLEEIFDVEKIDLAKKINDKEDVFLIVFVGVNGSGKTTTIAKIANMLKEKGISCVLAAADTFRAAAIHQLEEHGEKLGLKVIKHDYGSDPAAVIFDAVKHAKAKGVKVVLADTAGRQHSNVNLVEEMKKIVRVNNPDLKIFVGESITGNDCVEQARNFNEAVGIDGIVLSKADVDDKGGAAVSVSFVTGKPILYIGTGQEYKDLEEFDKENIMKSLGF